MDRINIQLISRFALAQVVNVLLNNCKQNITPLSLLVGTIVLTLCCGDCFIVFITSHLGSNNFNEVNVHPV